MPKVAPAPKARRSVPAVPVNITPSEAADRMVEILSELRELDARIRTAGIVGGADGSASQLVNAKTRVLPIAIIDIAGSASEIVKLVDKIGEATVSLIKSAPDNGIAIPDGENFAAQLSPKAMTSIAWKSIATVEAQRLAASKGSTFDAKIFEASIDADKELSAFVKRSESTSVKFVPIAR